MSTEDSVLSVKQTLNLREDELPEIKKWEVGSEYDITLSVKMTSISKDEYGEKGINARFEVTGANVMDEDGNPRKPKPEKKEEPKDKSPEERKAKKINERIKKGRHY